MTPDLEALAREVTRRQISLAEEGGEQRISHVDSVQFFAFALSAFERAKELGHTIAPPDHVAVPRERLQALMDHLASIQLPDGHAKLFLLQQISAVGDMLAAAQGGKG